MRVYSKLVDKYVPQICEAMLVSDLLDTPATKWPPVFRERLLNKQNGRLLDQENAHRWIVISPHGAVALYSETEFEASFAKAE